MQKPGLQAPGKSEQDANQYLNRFNTFGFLIFCRTTFTLLPAGSGCQLDRDKPCPYEKNLFGKKQPGRCPQPIISM
jgi:hypothetical protein